MSNGKYSKKRKGVAAKAVIMILAVMLIVGCTIGGTLAWLTAKTTPVVNTFTYGDVQIGLEESANLNLKMVPGCTITKDPKAWVKTGSEACWLFVKIEKSSGFDSFMTFQIAAGWTLVQGETNVYARKVTSGFGTKYSILKDNQVSVKDTVTKEQLNALTENTMPKLTFTAYAVQLMKNNTQEFTAEEAWGIANP